MTQETNDVVTQELIERLRDRRGSIPIGCDKDGEVVFGDDHDALKAADALQSQSAHIAELRKVVEKCREKFDFYEQLHRLKCTAEGDEKADRNREMAAMCELSLSPRTQPVDRPIRVQLRRTKGWRMPPNTVSVARPTAFGNPWTVAGAREAGYSSDDLQLSSWCVHLFREWLRGNPHSLTRMLKNEESMRLRIMRLLPTLRGKSLACWCKPDWPCHADVLLELARSQSTPDIRELSL